MNWLSNLFRRGSCAGEHSMQLALMHRSLHHLERRIMIALEDITGKVDALSAEVNASNAKVDTLLTGFGDVKTELVALQKKFDSAVPITADDAAALVSKIDGIIGSVKGEEAKIDAALAPAPAPAPAAAEAPAEPAPVNNTDGAADPQA